MIKLFPQQSTFIILPDKPLTALERLKLKTREVVDNAIEEDDNVYYYAGTFNDLKFKIIKKKRQSQLFTPQITGYAEETKTGSILFINFNLFSGTIFYLLSAFFIAGLVAIFLILFTKLQTQGFIIIGSLIIFYLISIANFYQQVKEQKRYLTSVFNAEEKK